MPNKNKKPGKRDRPPKKSKSSTASPNQKENGPKKAKIFKPDPEDSIAMSQELIMYKKRKSLNRSKTTKRVRPNGKPMPSLADLEKMYEDSDDDTISKKVTKIDSKNSSPVNDHTTINLTLFSPTTYARVTEQDNSFSVNDDATINLTLISPTTCAKVAEQAMEALCKSTKTSQNDDATTTEPPPRKRLKFGEKKCLTMNEIKSPFAEPSENDEKLLKDDDLNISETSTDSNKTIEYKITPSILKSNIISQVFSPLPSTSKDSKTFSKNDELFYECTKEINNNKPQETVTTSQINEIPIKTTTSGDEQVIEDCQMDVNKKNSDDILVDDSEDQNNLSNTTNPCDQKCNDDDDDDCIFIDSYINTKPVSKEPEFIDLEYDFIDTDTYNYDHSCHDDNDDKIIDLDALIARNLSILNKYKLPEKLSNPIVDVDLTKILDNPTDTFNTQKPNNDRNIASTAPETSNKTSDLQGQINNEVDIINVIDLGAENVSNNLEMRNLTNNEPINVPNRINGQLPTKHVRNNRTPHIFTEHDVSEFFNSVVTLRNPHIGPSSPLKHYLIDLVSGLEFVNNSTLTQHLPATSQRKRHIPSTPPVSITQNASSSLIQRPQPAPIIQRPQPAPIIQRPQPAPIIQTLPPPPVHSTTQNTQHKQSTSNKKNKNRLGDCPICLEKLSDCVIASTICGHVFCMRCLEQAIKTNKRCPNCRKIIKKNGYHQIFL